MKHAPENDYLTAQEVANILMLSVLTVRELLRSNKFPNARRPGRSWLVPRSDVNAYLEEKNK